MSLAKLVEPYSSDPTKDQRIDGLLSGYAWSSLALTFSFPDSASDFGANYGDTHEPEHNFTSLSPMQMAAAIKIFEMYASFTKLTFDKVNFGDADDFAAEIRFGETTSLGFRDAEGTVPVKEAHAYYPADSQDSSGGDVWFWNSSAAAGSNYDSPRRGDYAFVTFIHEIGHALGLRHPHQGPGDPAPFGAYGPAQFDTVEYSVMSYRSYVDAPLNGYTQVEFPSTPMQDDIQALQFMYGANFGSAGETLVYSWDPHTGARSVNGVVEFTSTQNKIFETVWDGGSHSVYDFSQYGNDADLKIDLRPGHWSSLSQEQIVDLDPYGHPGQRMATGNIANALEYKNDWRSLVDDARGGAGGDHIVGNRVGNTLAGADGDDRLEGGGGNDLIEGGDGDDTAIYAGSAGQLLASRQYDGFYKIERHGTVVTIAARSPLAEGVDTLTEVEWIEFADHKGAQRIRVSSLEDLSVGTHSGGDASDGGTTSHGVGAGGNDGSAAASGGTGAPVIGDATSEYLHGTKAAELIQGLGGDDVLTGYAGKDTFDGGEGSDTVDYSYQPDDVKAAIDLGAGTAAFEGYYTETLTSIENVWSGAGNDTIVGTSGANDLRGGPGDDVITAGGGNDLVYGDWKFSDKGGIDTAVVTYTFGSGYTVSGTANALRIVGAEGDDRFYNVEKFEFEGGVVKTAAEVLAAGAAWHLATGAHRVSRSTSVNEVLTHDQNGNPRNMAVLTNGQTVLVWGDVLTGNTSDVRVQLLSSTGEVVGSSFVVDTGGLQGQSVVAALLDGGFVIGMTDGSQRSPDTSGVSTRLQMFNADGTSRGASIVVNQSTAGDQVFENVIRLSDGNLLVTWRIGGGSDWIGRVVTAAGVAISDEFSLARPTMSAVALQDNNILLSYVQNNKTRAMVVNAAGSVVVAEFVVSDSASGPIGATELADGRLAFVFQSGSTTAVRLFSASGSAIGASVTIDTVAVNYQPSLVAIGGGGFALAYITGGNGGTATVKLRVFDATGSERSSFSVASLATFGGSPSVDLIATASGNLIVTWWQGGDLLAATYSTESFNAAPTSKNDAFSVTESGVVAGQMLANNGNGADSDADGDPISVVEINGSQTNVGHLITLTSGATLTVNPDGRFVYDPNKAFDALDPGQTGTDSFTYTISDGLGHSSTATATVTISGLLNGLRITNGAGVLEGTTADDQIAAGDGDDKLSGGDSFDWLQGSGGLDQLLGGEGNDYLDGGSGGDTIEGGAGFDYIDGAGDSDTAVYSGKRSDYTIVEDADGSLTITDDRAGSPDGSDVVVNVESFKFADGTLALSDIQDHAPTNVGPTSVSVAENAAAGATVTVVTATDADAGDVVQFTLTENASTDNAQFSLDASTGALSFKASPDFESPADSDHDNTYAVEVKATDSRGLFVTQTISVSVTNVNEVPTSLTLSSSTVAENSAPGTVVGTLSVLDPDAGDTASYWLDDSAGGLFAIEGSRLVVAGPLDYESTRSHAVTISVKDSANNSAQKQLTIDVGDANEAPSAVTFSNAQQIVAENMSTADRVKVADIGITDDALGLNGLTLSGADAKHFEIADGALYLKAGTTLDFETKPSYAITVSVDDAGVGASPDAGKAFTLAISDVNEPAQVTLTNKIASIAENTSIPARVKVADIVVTDDALGTNALVITGDDAAFFEIIGNALYLKAGSILDFEQKGSYSVSVGADDPALPGSPDAAGAGFKLSIGDVSPEIVSGTAGNDALFGGALADKLTGLGGDDVLDGGGGADTLTGGAGDDTYGVDNALDVVVELPGQGIDTVRSTAATYKLAANVENLVLLDSGGGIGGTGNTLGNAIIGNRFANTIDGGSGNDRIEGGAGGDVLIGGTGIDILSYASSGAGVVVALNGSVAATSSGGDAGGDVATGFESIVGSTHADRLTGDKAANVIEGGGGADQLDGGLGADTLSYAGSSSGVTVALNGSGAAAAAGGDAEGDIATGFENITGSQKSDVLTGDAGVNVLTGLGGSDTLDGKGGLDILAGGAGDDIYVLDQAGDKVVELTGEGSDTIRIGASYVLGAHVENLELQGSGDVSGTGNELSNIIAGTTGKNRLDGGGGADSLRGGSGDDTYVVDNSGDIVTELTEEGGDTVEASTSFALSDNLENLVLTGNVAIDGKGNELRNVITGNSGANVIEGGGEADILSGGSGIDTLSYAGSAQGVSVTLVAGKEAVVSGGDAAGDKALGFENVLGSAHADVLTGDAGVNVLDGNGGADSLAGGLGNDTYVVDDLDDKTIELDKGGVDTVRASIDWSLADANGAYIENLTLIGGDLAGTGNALANTLTGTAGANVLDGGLGADKLIGGSGNDTYFVDSTGDKITEAAGAGGGIDTVRSSLAAYTLAANVENLELLGSADIAGTGNTLDNRITGNDGANSLTGGTGDDTLIGGLGADVLTGGTGKDVFLYLTPTDGGALGDVIKDYSFALGDRVQISGVGFGLSPGDLGLTLFEAVASGGASGIGNASTRFFYDLAADKLYFDGDGGDRSNGVLLATFSTATTLLSAADIKIV